jgi:subtilase family serine protease
VKQIVTATLALAALGTAASADAAKADAAVLRPSGSLATIPTATRAFPILPGTTDLGSVPSAMPMHVVVGLAPRNSSLVATIVKRQGAAGDPLFEKFLTPAQSANTFAPTGNAVQAVSTYLVKSGFTNLSVTPDNLLISAYGTAAAVDAAFKTKIDFLNTSGGGLYANVLPALVPASLKGAVAAVLGLNSYKLAPTLRFAPPPAQSRLRSRDAAALRPAGSAGASAPQPCELSEDGLCVLNSYSATGFQIAYDAPAYSGNPNTWGSTGKSTPIALFTEGDMTTVLTDLVDYENANVPVLPHVKTKVINAGVPSPDVSGQDEWDLDSQTSTGMAGNVKELYFYVATSLTDADTAVAFDRFKTDDIARAGSASFGECEFFPMLDGAEIVEDAIFAQAAVQGQTVFSSAGDNGTTCPVGASTGVPGTGLPAQSYPGVSPYVVSAGGTTLVTNTGAGTYNAEVAWYGTGGGMSESEYSPFWQAGVVSPVATKAGYKEVPDVAMDADPDTGAAIYVDGVVTGVGGTSLSSPLSPGVWARLETYHTNKLGFAAPLLYQEYKNSTTYNPTVGLYMPPTPPAGALTQPIGGFHDILTGTNGTPALPGYDTTTGLGTSDISLQFTNLPTTY